MRDELTIDPPFHIDRADLAAPSTADLDAIFERVASDTVDHERGWRDRLRELPTPLRVLAALATALALCVAALGALGVRPLMDGPGLVAYGVALCGLVAMVALAVASSLRGVHQRPAGRWAWLVTVAALLTPMGLAVAAGFGGESHGGEVDLGLACLATGLVTAAAVGAVIRLFQRSDRIVDWRLTAMAGAGGLVGFATVQLHCPAVDLTHLVVGHGTVGLALAAGLLVLARLRA